MKRWNAIAVGVCLLCVGMGALLIAPGAAAQDPAVLAADVAFLQAAGKADKTALAGLLDANFSWTDMAGKTSTAAQVAQGMPKLLIGDESKAEVKRYSYGPVAVVREATRKAELARSSLAGLAPTPLSWARMSDFGDAVVMESEHQPDRGKPLHVTRVWVKRGGGWVETLSYQTSIQAAAGR